MSEDEQALLALENRRVEAMNAADSEAMLPLLADDHVHVLANGVVTDRAGAAAGLKEIPRRVEPRTPEIRVFGDVAVLTGLQVNHEPDRDGGTQIIKLYLTEVARRIDGEWKFVSLQATRLRG